MLSKLFRNPVWRWMFVVAVVGSFCTGCVIEDHGHHHHDDWHDHPY